MTAVAAAAAPMQGAASLAAPWPLWQRVGFRFLFAYLALYFFPLPAGISVGVWEWAWQAIVPWVAAHVLHRPITVFTNGSGDTTYDYVRVLCMAVLAAAAGVVWSAVDRKRRDYRRLHGLARVWLRYVLAICMLTYGAVKVIKLQFPTPGYVRLSETYGESSPMALLWTFMGFSTGYTFFAGAGECLGAFLLFFRRTTTLGALVVIGVMSNVVTLNYCYDVPVKLGSSHLLGLAFFLAAPDMKRVADVFVLNRPTAPLDLGPHIERRWLRVTRIALKSVIIGVLVLGGFGGALVARAQYGSGNGIVAPPEGFYAVTAYTEDGEALAEQPGGRRWKTFVLQHGNKVRLWWPDRSTRAFATEGDASAGSLTLFPVSEADGERLKDAPAAGTLHLAVQPDGSATAEGSFEARAITVAMTRKDPEDFPLMKRGFHWVNEAPFNK
jgi:hypothetical protein